MHLLLRVTPQISPKFCELPLGFLRVTPPGFLRITPGILRIPPGILRITPGIYFAELLLCRTIILSIRAPFENVMRGFVEFVWPRSFAEVLRRFAEMCG